VSGLPYLTTGQGLRDLDVEPIYVLPDDAFIDDVLVPSLRCSEGFDCMVGFFESSALADLAPGLAAYLSRDTASVRLIISPVVSEDDFRALREGVTLPAAIIQERLLSALQSASVSENALAKHTLLCLSYLLATARISIQVALVPGGIWHPKVWVFSRRGDVLVAQGSSNMTGAGLTRNVEQVSVDRSWGTEREQQAVCRLTDFFAAVWSGRSTKEFPEVAVYPLPDAVKDELLRLRPPKPPTEEGYVKARTTPVRRPPRNPRPPARRTFAVPEGVVLDQGPFAHQAQAIAAWKAADRRGILAMATGSGKTITSLAAAVDLAAEGGGPLLVVIAAPQRPLLAMWERETREFGADPVVLGAVSGANKIAQLETVTRRLSLGASPVEVVVCTHDGLIDGDLQRAMAVGRFRRLLIADEVHHLGRAGFLSDPPDFFEYRLGLSATPERQFDPAGSAAIEEFFGPLVYEFGLDKAIGVCLVPFDYYVHFVDLTATEMATWRELTQKMRKLLAAQAQNQDDQDLQERIELLRFRRRRVVELAEQKPSAFDEVLRARASRASRALAYGSDKDPSQLPRIHQVLDSLGYSYHRVTQAETSAGGLAERVLASFGRGELDFLTAKRVLDEGINVPSIREAYVLASTRTRRQWVQRLGRVLRVDSASGKSYAAYHDFVPLPEPREGRDDDARLLVRQELERIRFIGGYSRNHTDSEGWLAAGDHISGLFFT
jgi:superfamily II DNA or RNA helicase